MSGRSPAAVSAHEWLSARIASGEIPAGARLTESSVAETLGISRTPVREALRQLASDGLVEVNPHRGAQVVSFTPEEVAGLFAVRVTLEPQATAAAIPRLGADDLARMADLCDQMESLVEGAGDMVRLGQLNREFHECLLDACENRALAAAVLAVVRPGVVHRTFHRYSEAALQRSMAHHREIVAAAEAGDADWAESVMRTHILAARHVAFDQPQA